MKIGDRIYYSGDQANCESEGTVTACFLAGKYSGEQVEIRFDQPRFEGDKMISRTDVINFGPGPGRRFWLLEEWEADRKERLKAMQEHMRAVTGKREMTFQEKLERLSAKISEQTREVLSKKYNHPGIERSWEVKIIPGRKYVKVDIGHSGKYMVEVSTERIFGIKAYGSIRRGHLYGTLDTIDDWWWGGYTVGRIRK